MRRYLMLAVAAATLFGMNAMAATPSAPKSLSTARCRDAKGHFVACAKKVAPRHCRGAKGKFVRCPE